MSSTSKKPGTSHPMILIVVEVAVATNVVEQERYNPCDVTWMVLRAKSVMPVAWIVIPFGVPLSLVAQNPNM